MTPTCKVAIALALLFAGCAAPSSSDGTLAGKGILPLGGTPTADSGAATADAAAVQPSGKTDPAMQADAKDGGKVAADKERSDVSWGAAAGGVYIKASVPGIHYNLNQAAKVQDALADDWSLVFAPDAPFRKEDALYFCGANSSVTVQVYDRGHDAIIYDGAVDGVPPC